MYRPMDGTIGFQDNMMKSPRSAHHYPSHDRELSRVLADDFSKERALYRLRKNGHLALVAFAALCYAASSWAGAEPGDTTHNPGYWLPEDASTAGYKIDFLFNLILYITSIVCVAVFVVLIYFLVKYRYQPGRATKFIHGNNSLEAVWTLIPTLIMAFIAAYSQATWSEMKSPHTLPRGEGVVEVKVAGRQFQWFFHYAGKDGKFGKTNRLWRKNDGDPANEIGLMRGDPEERMSPELFEEISADPDRQHLLDTDPAARDDIVVGRMIVPVGRKVTCEIYSIDVLHSFYLPNFRVKQDAVPGLLGFAWFESTATSAEFIGTTPDGEEMLGYSKPFDIVCAELCGQGHYKMRGQLYVVTEDQYQAFLEEETSYLGLDEEEDEGY